MTCVSYPTESRTQPFSKQAIVVLSTFLWGVIITDSMNIRKDETKQFVAEKLDRSRTEKAKKVPALHLEES